MKKFGISNSFAVNKAVSLRLTWLKELVTSHQDYDLQVSSLYVYISQDE